jgi:hypothetical protein
LDESRSSAGTVKEAWRVTKDGRTIACELRDDSNHARKRAADW